MTRNMKRGFTLVEILIVVIILGILAAIVIPQFTNASQDARRSSMTSQLQTLRSQIELFKLQHKDRLPGFLAASGAFSTEATFWDHLTTRTNVDGVAPTGTETGFGPYLQAKSKNNLVPEAQQTTVSVPAAAVAVDAGTGRPNPVEFGYLFDYNGTGKIWAMERVNAANIVFTE